MASTPVTPQRFIRLIAMIVLVVLICYNIQTVGRVFARVYGIVQGLMVEFEMSHIKSSLIATYQGGNRLPQPGDEFDAFVRSSFGPSGKRDPARDRFGHRYAFHQLVNASGRVNGFRIVSAGPDGKMNTKDDIVVTWTADPATMPQQ